MRSHKMSSKIYKLLVSILIAFIFTGCASSNNNKDPLQSLNRGVYKFNDVTDKYIIKPVSTTYKKVTPSPIRKGINNFFNNLRVIPSIVNNVLQLKFERAFVDTGRFVINLTFGIAGLIDLASIDGIPDHKEDFGQTLGHWGVGNGPYLVVPFIGPYTVRSLTGLTFDLATSDPITYVHNIGEIRLHNQIRAGQIIDKRTDLLGAKEIVDEASLDPYAFGRDAYLQNRASLVQDGLVPQNLINDEFFEPADEDIIDEISPATE